jgi:hypothetical protein
MYSDSPFRVTLARAAGTNLGHESLTTKYGRTLQLVNLPLLPRGLSVNGDLRRVWYYSFTADANLDDSRDSHGLPTIQYNETIGLNNLGNRPPLTPDAAWTATIEQIYRLLYQVQEAKVETRLVPSSTGELIPAQVLKEIPQPDKNPGLNDTLVTLTSGRVPELFQELATLKANHTSIANPNTGSMTLDAIRVADPVK